MRNKNIYFLLVASVLMLTACKKDLALQPTDSVDETKAFETVDDLQKGLNAAYARYSRPVSMYVSALASDEVKFGPDNGGSGQFTYRLQYGADGTTGGDVLTGFGSFYTLIDQVNRVLPNIETVAAVNPGDDAKRPVIKAQLLALRAIGHFDLLNWYSKKYDAADPLGVPVMVKSELLGRPARNTVAEVLAQIDADIQAAKSLLPDVTAGTFADLSLNKISIAAFEARVALYKGDWQKAIDLATTVIGSGIKPLVTGDDFRGIWTDVNTNETLFRLRYENTATLGTLWTATNGNVIFSPSDKINNSYDDADIRKAAYIGNASGKRYVNKFYTSSRGGRIVDAKAIRTAEMYLIRAEAYARLATPNIAAGTADLNALRAKRITGYTDESFGSAQALIDAVLQERFKELFLEGFRFFDLKRQGLAMQRNSSDVDSPNWQTLPANSFRFTLPIPQDEILANPNMVPNPGYN
ncbi:MAG: RagB/SusD family nutrient uptake outer membrane protein [Chitinophagaceae bacterium]|nr:RagB/SusD family nutrient uptake outer membrane protein [Chitinophagaceae bacterium]